VIFEWWGGKLGCADGSAALTHPTTCCRRGGGGLRGAKRDGEALPAVCDPALRYAHAGYDLLGAETTPIEKSDRTCNFGAVEADVYSGSEVPPEWVRPIGLG
jgi:hypothetical protein